MENELLLLSGNDIPFIGGQLTIHQPTIKEIAYIGEEAFYSGCELLRFSKDNLSKEDRINLENQTNFDIIMSIVNDRSNIAMQQYKIFLTMLLSLIFPTCSIRIGNKDIQLTDNENKEEVKSINSKNFNEFLDILNSMFCLKPTSGDGAEFNPEGDLAKKIADKLRRGRQKKEEQLPQSQKKVAILSRYVSILATGQQKNFNDLFQYTVYQLLDEFQRYQAKVNFDIYIEAKMAGAKDLQEVDDWMKDFHSDSNK